jgi:hypothetical protein
MERMNVGVEHIGWAKKAPLPSKNISLKVLKIQQ